MSYPNSLFALFAILALIQKPYISANEITGQSTIEKCDYDRDGLDCWDKLITSIVIDVPAQGSNTTNSSTQFTLVIDTYTDD